MTKKYTYLVHIALFLAAMILLCLGFFLENPNGGLIAEQRAMPTCKEVQEVAEETRSDAAAPQGVTREFHFTLDNNLTEKLSTAIPRSISTENWSLTSIASKPTKSVPRAVTGSI